VENEIAAVTRVPMRVCEDRETIPRSTLGRVDGLLPRLEDVVSRIGMISPPFFGSAFLFITNMPQAVTTEAGKAAILAVHALGLKTQEKLGDAAFRRLHA
jgi:hypothetical protein